MVSLKEFDNLAGKFIIGHKKLSKRKKYILDRIEFLKMEERKLELRKQRVRNLITILYSEVMK